MQNDIQLWFDHSTNPDEDFYGYLSSQEAARKRTLRKVYVDLVKLARDLGQTPAQTRNKVEGLFRAFTAEVFLFTFLGTSDLADAIAADATLPWLDTDVQGATIRQRLLNRL